MGSEWAWIGTEVEGANLYKLAWKRANPKEGHRVNRQQIGLLIERGEPVEHSDDRYPLYVDYGHQSIKKKPKSVCLLLAVVALGGFSVEEYVERALHDESTSMYLNANSAQSTSTFGLPMKHSIQSANHAEQ